MRSVDWERLTASAPSDPASMERVTATLAARGSGIAKGKRMIGAGEGEFTSVRMRDQTLSAKSGAGEGVCCQLPSSGERGSWSFMAGDTLANEESLGECFEESGDKPSDFLTADFADGCGLPRHHERHSVHRASVL